MSCGGGAYEDYAEIAGIQLLKLATAPTPPALVAHAGTARSLSPVSPSATLGASPAATGGSGPYTYAWSPSTGLNDATGFSFTGQSGSWNRLNIGSYNRSSASSGFLNTGAGTATTVKLLLGSATGIANPGGWRCDPNEGAPGGAQQLRKESA